MTRLNKSSVIGVVGAGTMGSGIAQLASMYDHQVLLFDTVEAVRRRVPADLRSFFERQVQRGKLSEAKAREMTQRIEVVERFDDLRPCDIVIEAVFENLEVKQETFRALENVVGEECLLATNTSSLPVAAIAAACADPGRVIGAHFFNPAPVMPLVEIIPGLLSRPEAVQQARELINTWGKTTVLAKDTPGFIVNRIARPFYGEALRVLEEGIADVPTVDWAMREIGGFKMGPFELMDFIGNDVNYKVTETVFESFYYEPRYRPSVLQRRLVEAKLFGRKSGRGYYDYAEEATKPSPKTDHKLGTDIFFRILVMLINEAADAVFLRVASVEDIDLAMTKGVNYPRGLLQWADEVGIGVVLNALCELQAEYGEDRYRPSPLLRRLVRNNRTFYDIARC